jgi:outer membrane protein OmpA-like peptidoglycan-associated protein
MKSHSAFTLLFALLVVLATTQTGAAKPFPDDAFWVSHWAQAKIILNGPDEEAFYQNLKVVMFRRNQSDRCINPEALDDDARWLKSHPDIRFYVDGYASKRGDADYNLKISKRRADFVKQSLIKRGVPEDRIVLSVGWGELYPSCLEDTEECLARNKVVRFTYVPGS